MKKLLVILILFALSSSSMAFPYMICPVIFCCSTGTEYRNVDMYKKPPMMPTLEGYEEHYRMVYGIRKIEQKYRFSHEVRETRQEGRLREIKAKSYQKVRKRYGYSRNKYGYRNDYRGGTVYW